MYLFKNLLISCLFFVSFVPAQAQTDRLGDSLKKGAQAAVSFADKMESYSRLADYHYASNDSLSQYYQQKSIEAAELSRDRQLIIRAWLKLANRSLFSAGKMESVHKGREAATKALEIARAEKLDEQAAFCQIVIARTWRIEGDAVKALEVLNAANSVAVISKNDSLKVSVFNALGDVYLQQNNNLQSFRNYINGLEAAENSDNYRLLTASYGRLADFYQVIEQYEKAKDYAYKILELDSLHKDWTGVLDDYNNIGRIYSNQKDFAMALYFFEKAISKAGEMGMERYKVKCYANIANMYFGSGRYQEGLAYLQRSPALTGFLEKAGMGPTVDFARGSVYNQMGRGDSAFYYLKKVQPFYEQFVTPVNRFGFYTVFADHLARQKDYTGSLAYYEKAKAIAEQTKSIELLKFVYRQMDSTSSLAGKYQLAYEYRGLAERYTDSIESLSKEKDLVAIEIDKENRQKEKREQEAAERKRKRHNIQYMGITAAIGGIFILLVAAGLFSVSRGTVRIIGFFAFIFLFEFIILLADNEIHHWTHGEPWKVMAIKILLIAMLLPLHHFLEHKAIAYLNEKNMLRSKKKHVPKNVSDEAV